MEAIQYLLPNQGVLHLLSVADSEMGGDSETVGVGCECIIMFRNVWGSLKMHVGA